MSTKPISDKQVGFARSLMAERLVTLGLTTVDEAAQATDLVNMTSQQARTMIDRLLALPKDPDPNMPDVVRQAQRYGTGNRPGTCYTCANLVGQDEGFYFLDGSGHWAVHHKVGACSEPPAANEQVGIDLSHVPDGVYAVPDGETRLKVKVSHTSETSKWKGTIFVNDAAVYGWQGALGRQSPGKLYIGKAMDELAAIASDPQAAMAAYGHLTGKCGMCGRHLEDEVSVARGIGPVCIKKAGWS